MTHKIHLLEKASIIIMILAFTACQSTDNNQWKFHQYKGNPKKVVTFLYDGELSNLAASQDPLYRKVTHFNKDGYITHDSSYRVLENALELESSATYSYEDDIIGRKDFNASGNLLKNTAYRYKNDSVLTFAETDTNGTQLVEGTILVEGAKWMGTHYTRLHDGSKSQRITHCFYKPNSDELSHSLTLNADGDTLTRTTFEHMGQDTAGNYTEILQGYHDQGQEPSYVVIKRIFTYY